MKKISNDQIVNALDDLTNEVSDISDLLRKRLADVEDQIEKLSLAVFHLDEEEE